MTAREGVVSAWAGSFPDEDALLAYVATSHPGDGPAESPFRGAWPVGPYDEDFSEAALLPAGLPREDAVAQHSYAASFAGALLADLARRPECTALYLIYDHDASGVVPVAEGPMRFLGTYRYERT